MEMVGRDEGDALAARISALPADELLEVWESLTAVVARRALEEPHSLTSRPEGGDTVDGRLDALIATRRELEHAAQVAQRVSRRAEAVLHLVTGAHHASVRAYDQLSAEQVADLGAHPVEAGEYAAASMGAALALSTPAARVMVETARSLRRRFPRLLDAAIAGDGVMRVAGMLADELDHLDDESSARVEAALVAGGVHRRSHQAARERCRAILRQMGLARSVDPIAAERERGVWFEPHLDFDNLCRMTAVLDTFDAAAVKAVVGERARQLWENSTPASGLTMAQARADALVDLVVENSSVTATLNLTIPVVGSPARGSLTHGAHGTFAPLAEAVTMEDAPTPLGDRSPLTVGCPSGAPPRSSDVGGPVPRRQTLPALGNGVSAGFEPAFEACVVPGVGIIPADVVARLATRVGTGLTATLTCAGDGRVTTLATTTRAYRPSAGIAKLVRERDGVCRFPYCTASATHSDLDHVVPFDQGGPTTATNLQALCRHHHRAKTHGGFTVTMAPDADSTWSSPTGSRWLTEPGGITHRVAAPVRAA